MIEYKIEELVPIVGKLAQKYTAGESTSISYEKAEQLMGAVLYCVREAQESGAQSMALTEGLSAQQAYETGAVCVAEKVKRTLDLYNEALPKFRSYGNCCLYDTFAKGLPEFFKWYDSQFEPQNTILTLDYPVLRDLSAYTGIDKVYEFVICVCLEQDFLNGFPEEYVITVLSRYNREYRDMIDNLCEIVLLSVIGHILAGKPLPEMDLEEKDYLSIQKIFAQTGLEDINTQLKNAVKEFVRQYYGACDGLMEYLSDAVRGIAVRLKNAADCHAMRQIL